MTYDCDVLIVGAGPCGLTLACDLLRRGIGVRLIDMLDSPVVASKGKGLQPRTLEVFDNLGVADKLIAAGRLYPTQRLYKADEPPVDRIAFAISPTTAQTPYPNALMLPQWKTEAILRERLAQLGGAVDQNVDFVSLEQAQDGVTASLRGSSGLQTLRARFLVGSDGGRSATRKALGIPLIGETPAIDGLIVADLLVEGLDRDYWHIWEGGRGLMRAGFCPLPSTDAFQFMSSVAPDENPPLTLEHLQSLTRDVTGRDDLKLHDLTWVSLFRPNIRMAERFRAGRVFIAGDAAHIHPPTGGQGLNASVQDAFNLGWKLAAVLRGADPKLLDTYEVERMPLAEQLLAHAESLYRRSLDQDGSAWNRGDREKQLQLSYRNGPLTFGKGEGALQPGDRMPDMRLVGADGVECRLFDILRAGKVAILAVGLDWLSRRPGVRVLQIGTAGLQDVDSVLDPTPHYIAIRPDGYVGAIGTDHQAVGEFLSAVTPSYDGPNTEPSILR